MFSFGLTWSAYGWLIKAGVLKTFYAISSVQLAICLLSIPMCMYYRVFHFPGLSPLLFLLAVRRR